MAKNSHYPAYDVWDEHREWDPHTRQIVGKRRSPQVSHQFFSHGEAMLVQELASVLVDDHRLEVLTFITQHVDEAVASPIGESQRKVGVPKKKELYRLGLQGVNEVSQDRFGAEFLALQKEQQLAVLTALESGTVANSKTWGSLKSKDFFKRLLHDVVSAYYSHPLVWSDIGYGGPAYPRGYVRVEKGLVDPWEAKADGK
ncbi:gluconate 2-dehydrogenase subunit 3 family protein [Brevibacillus sp. H7]|jgi:hypothetical protein|uniref:gluconate 2-dehydrogenase subunit 3 family protein n=1 Tax=Brevibacillus sp. H7 TaxID=3349138 RepID=UPI00380DDC1D